MRLTDWLTDLSTYSWSDKAEILLLMALLHDATRAVDIL